MTTTMPCWSYIGSISMLFIDIRLKHYEYNCTNVIRYIKTSQHKPSTFIDGLSKGYTDDS